MTARGKQLGLQTFFGVRKYPTAIDGWAITAYFAEKRTNNAFSISLNASIGLGTLLMYRQKSSTKHYTLNTHSVDSISTAIAKAWFSA